MKWSKRASIMLLAGLMVLCTLLAACQEPETPPVTTGDATSQEITGSIGTETEFPSHNIPDTKYDGAKIRFITANEGGNGIDVGVLVEEAVDQVSEAVYLRDRNVEDMLGVVLESRAYATYPEAYNALKTSVDSGADDFDIGFLRTDQAFVMAGEQTLYDLNDYGCIDLSKPWWDQSINEMHTIGGKLYLGIGSASVNDLLRTHMLLFNSNLFDEKNLDYPYQMVLDGTWTIDKLAEYATTLNEDMNGDTVVDMENDRFGFASYSWTSGYTLWYSCGGDVINVDEDGYPYVEFDDNKVVEIYEKLFNAVVTSGSNYVSDGNLYGDLYNSFTEGRVFLTEACMMHLTHWETFRDMRDDYGIIPAPKLNEQQADYISYAEVVEPALVIPITTTSSEEMLSAVAEALNYEGYRTITPVVYQTALKDRFARDEASKEMLDIISGNRTSCLALVFIPNTSIVTSIPVLLQNKTDGIVSYLESFRSAMVNGMADAVNKFQGA